MGYWIGKFPSKRRDEGFDIVGLEATCMRLARLAKLDVPDTRLVAVGARRALLVRRFDVSARGGRHHMLSLRTLGRERPGVYVMAYSELAQIVRKVSASPQANVNALYRHMVFNAVIGNTDDHLKNFWMLHTQVGYRLSPAFDLVPDVARRGEHTLAFEYNHTVPTGTTLLSIAKHWGVRDARCMHAIHAHWPLAQSRERFAHGDRCRYRTAPADHRAGRLASRTCTLAALFKPSMERSDRIVARRSVLSNNASPSADALHHASHRDCDGPDDRIAPSAAPHWQARRLREVSFYPSPTTLATTPSASRPTRSSRQQTC